MSLLIAESPLQVLPGLAVAIGLNEAMLLQQMHYWINKSKHGHEGHTVFHKTILEFQGEFPFWSDRTIKRAIASLKEKKLILIWTNLQNRKFGDLPDRTNWYAINYAQLEQIEMEIQRASRSPSSRDKMASSVGTNCPHQWGQNGTSRSDKVARQTETTNTENTKDKDINTMSDSEESNDKQSVSASKSPKPKKSDYQKLSNPEWFDTFWQAYAYKTGKQPAAKAWKAQGLDSDQVLADQVIKQAKHQACHRFDFIKDNGKYKPHPSSWLNARRWEDEDFELLNPHTRPQNGVHYEHTTQQAGEAPANSKSVGSFINRLKAGQQHASPSEGHSEGIVIEGYFETGS